MAKKTTCHICGLKFKDKNMDTRNCPLCDSDLANTNTETVQRSERCTIIADGAKAPYSGNIVLTDKRIVFVQDSTTSSALSGMFGLLGALIAMFITSGGAKSTVYTLDRSTIRSAEEGKRALARFVDVTLKDGAVYRFGFSKKRLQDWLTIINDGIAK